MPFLKKTFSYEVINNYGALLHFIVILIYQKTGVFKNGANHTRNKEGRAGGGEFTRFRCGNEWCHRENVSLQFFGVESVSVGWLQSILPTQIVSGSQV